MNGKSIYYDDESGKTIQTHDKYEYYFDDDSLYSNYQFVKLTNTIELFAVIKSVIIDIDELMKLDLLDYIVKHVIQSNTFKQRMFDNTLRNFSMLKDDGSISDEEMMKHTQNISVLKKCHSNEHVSDVINVIEIIITEFMQYVKTIRDMLIEIYCNMSRTITAETSITDIIKLFDANNLLSYIKRLLLECGIYESYMTSLASEFDSKDSYVNDILFDVSEFIVSGIQGDAGHLINFLDQSSHMYKKIYRSTNRHLHIRPDLFKNNMDILAFIKEEFKHPQTFQFDYM